MSSKPPIIKIDALNFGYTAKQQVLSNLSLSVPDASVYGFLGLNGAGKSTTIRSLLGLLKPQSGTIKIFGEELNAQNKFSILSRVGALIEAPSIYKHLSGYDNLKITCKYLNLPLSRIDEVLDLVNLQKNKNKISKHYSTGMKQRLGLAIALLSDPDLLILDEPTNGLDPSGIIEIRETLQELNQRGKTIFLSSHLLSEIEKIATQVGVIKEGSIVFQGTIRELHEVNEEKVTVKMTVSDAPTTISLLDSSYEAILINSERLEFIIHNREELSQLIQQIRDKDIKIYEVNQEKNNLEQLFMNLTEA